MTKPLTHIQWLKLRYGISEEDWAEVKQAMELARREGWNAGYDAGQQEDHG